jgi:organic radical activating enzyme
MGKFMTFLYLFKNMMNRLSILFSCCDRNKIYEHIASPDKNDIQKIVLHSTDMCNLNCKYCSRGIPFNKSKKSYLASEFIPWLNFLTKKGIIFKTITISGGEPFLHPNIFDFIDELKYNDPNKVIRLITNFSWASEKSIQDFTPKLKNLDNCVISKYPSIIEKFGGNEQFDLLVLLFKENCPHIHIEVHETSHFISWELHEHKESVNNICATEQAKCHTLGIDGIIRRCVIACGAQNINEYKSILEMTSDHYFDLKQWDKNNFFNFAHKYPFDLCEHCTFTQYKSVNWGSEDRIKRGDLTSRFN